MAPARETDLSNETLVAYIDGELDVSERETVAAALSQDAGARARLERLKRGGRPFGEAFDILFRAAPEDKLQAIFADAMRKTQGPESEDGQHQDDKVVPLHPQTPSRSTPLWGMAAAAVALAIGFGGGLIASGFFKEQPQIVQTKPGWREVAARYVALFSKETLDGMPTSRRQRSVNLAKIETALDFDLSRRELESPNLSFRGTQLLQFEGKPLAQISYLHRGKTPVALCLIRSGKPAAAPANEVRHGLNIVHWVAGGYGFMLIGDVPDKELGDIAETFRKRFS